MKLKLTAYLMLEAFFRLVVRAIGWLLPSPFQLLSAARSKISRLLPLLQRTRLQRILLSRQLQLLQWIRFEESLLAYRRLEPPDYGLCSECRL